MREKENTNNKIIDQISLTAMERFRQVIGTTDSGEFKEGAMVFSVCRVVHPEPDGGITACIHRVFRDALGHVKKRPYGKLWITGDGSIKRGPHQLRKG